jgi:hypothetical protein
MNRRAAFALFACLGCVLAFATAMPSARSGTALHKATQPEAGLPVPMAWIASAVAAAPFMPPPAR